MFVASDKVEFKINIHGRDVVNIQNLGNVGDTRSLIPNLV